MQKHADTYQKAQEELKSRRFSAARQLFLEAASLQGLDLPSLITQAQRLLDGGDIKAALQLYLQIFEHNPTDIDALLGLTKGALFLHQLEDANAYLSALFAMDPQHPQALTLRET